MKIAESTIQMCAGRQAWQMGSKGRDGVMGATGFQDITSKIMGTKYDTYVPKDGQGGTLLGNPYNKNGVGVSEVGSADGATKAAGASAMQYDLLGMLWQRMMQSMGIFGGGGGVSSGMEYNSTYLRQVATYSEYESTSFHANGKAITEDGRTIEFNIDVSMTRSYQEYFMVEAPRYENLLMDPLVVNVGSNVTHISDQQFRFDLDGDGEPETINQLASGSGFLALDKNGDGIINDGTELFGTQSGDAFGDLRAYDSDGNGWIDENDEIFDKLRVWCKGENGEDILMNLKDADVGAIYLGEEKTEFSLMDGFGGFGAKIGSTGFFIRESGTVSTVQHVDMVVHEQEEVSEIPVVATTVNDGVTTTNGVAATVGTTEAVAQAKASESEDTSKEDAKKKSDRDKANLEARRARRKAEQKQLTEAAQKRREENRKIANANYERARERHARWKERISEEHLRQAYGV